MGNELNLHFIKPGLQTLIQDTGRTGYRDAGIPLGGAMDTASALNANYLVGNSPHSPVLEISLLGPKIIFQGSGQIAICGAHLSPTLNDQSLEMNKTIPINDGDTLNFGRNINGCRAYIAIGGEWQIPTWLGSYSAAAYNGASLTPDSIITKGRQLKIHTKSFINQREITPNLPFSDHKPAILNVIPGPEFNLFSSLEIAHFFSQTYHLSTASNRMGCRLNEAIPNLKTNTNIISSAMIPGTVQIPPSGHPIVLMMDAQTTGGYARIVNIISSDLPKMAQAKPGDEIRFCL